MPRFSRLRTEPFALGLSTSLLLVPPALAETEEAALALPSQLVSVRQDPAELDHIDLATPVSAGSRLGLSALDTPASTSSISGEEVRRRNNPSVQAAVTRSPGISFIGTPGDGGTGLSARGFSGHASVMQLFDGTRLYTGMGTVNFPSDPWMVERIDVIRGPASVLYGEGATGAVINVVPKKPFAGEIRNHLRLGYGSYDNRQLALDSGGSLTDSLSYRLNLNQQQSHGWIDRGDSRNLGISAALRWQASDDLAFTLAHDYGDQEPMNDFGTPLVGGKYHKRLREKNYNVRNDVQRYNDQWTRLTSDWSLSDSVTASNQLYYIKARRHWRNAETYEWDVPREELLRRDYLRISHEQEQIGDRQTFAFQHALFGLDSRTLVGAEYNRIRFRLSNNSPYTDVGGDYIDPWHPAPGYFESRSPYRPHSRSQTRTFALFAENRLQLNERLSLVTGVRRDQNHIDRDDLRAGTRSDRSLQAGTVAVRPVLHQRGRCEQPDHPQRGPAADGPDPLEADRGRPQAAVPGRSRRMDPGRLPYRQEEAAQRQPAAAARRAAGRPAEFGRPGGQPGTEPGPGLAAVGERRAGACRIRRLRRNDRRADLLAQRQPPQERATAHRQPLAGQVLRRDPARRRRAALRRPALRRRRQPGQPARLHGGRRQPGLAGTAGPDPRP